MWLDSPLEFVSRILHSSSYTRICAQLPATSTDIFCSIELTMVSAPEILKNTLGIGYGEVFAEPECGLRTIIIGEWLEMSPLGVAF